jgi:DNA-binding CsgD family transcriptional regulator
MVRLVGRDVSALLEFLRDIYAVRDIRSFRLQLVSNVSRLVGSEITTYNEVDPTAKQHTSAADHPDALEFPDSHSIFDKHIAEHPLIGQYAQSGDCRALKISDFLTKSQFHSLGLYTDFYGRVGVQHQIAFVLPATRPMVIGIALNRSRPDFSERDRLLLNLIQPHVVQAYRNAKAVTQMSRQLGMAVHALEHLDSAVVVVNQATRVLVTTERARQLLAKYFPHPTPTGSQLPDMLRRWIRHHENNLSGTGKAFVRTPLIVDQEGSRLIVRLLSDADCALLSLMEQPKATVPEIFESFGLTRREAEVLSWVAQGKTNVVIGNILGLSPRTVQKHLEHIFQRLGVETRTAAAAWALQTRQESVASCPPQKRPAVHAALRCNQYS